MTAETLQELRFAFGELGGVTAAQVDKGLEKFNQQIGLAAIGNKRAADTLKQLGISFADSGGRARETEAVLNDTLAALANIESDSRRAALAARLFGEEAGAKLSASLAGGIKQLDQTREAVVGLISDQNVRDAELLNDSFERIAKTIGGSLRNAAIEATSDLAALFGLIDRGPAGDIQASIRDLERQISAFQSAAQAGALGGNQILLDQAEADLKRLQAQLRVAENIKPFSERRRLLDARRSGKQEADAFGDGLEEISVAARNLGTPLDGVMQQWRELWSDEGLQEASATLVKMPDDLMKLSPAFNTAVVANEKLIAGLKETDSQQQQLAASMGASFQDAFTGWILGAERSFSDLLKRMAVEFATSAIFKSLGSLFPGGGFFANFFGGARAEGGPVSAGKGYLVGERGPEMFFPGQSGMIAAGGGGVVYNDNSTFNFSGNRDDAPMLRAVLAQHKREVMAEIKDKQRRGRF